MTAFPVPAERTFETSDDAAAALPGMLLSLDEAGARG
jgi:hypothetical protein